MTHKKANRLAYRFILPYAAATLVLDGGLTLIALKMMSIVGYVMLAYELATLKDGHIAAAAAANKDCITVIALVFCLSVGFNSEHYDAKRMVPSFILREGQSG